MAKRFSIQMITVTDAPVEAEHICAAITHDMNARGLFLEQFKIEEIKEQAPVAEKKGEGSEG